MIIIIMLLLCMISMIIIIIIIMYNYYYNVTLKSATLAKMMNVHLCFYLQRDSLHEWVKLGTKDDFL